MDRQVEREVIVTDSGRGAGPASAVAAIVGIVLVALLAWGLFAFFGGGSDGDGGASIPGEVNVNVDSGSSG